MSGTIFNGFISYIYLKDPEEVNLALLDFSLWDSRSDDDHSGVDFVEIYTVFAV